MASIFQIDQYNDRWRTLPSGVLILDQHLYSAKESAGVLAVSIASMVSLAAILLLFGALTISFFKDWFRSSKSSGSEGRQTFIRSHVGVYFICMLVSNVIFTVGFMLSIVWAVEKKITFGTFCTIQAALKQFGNVATAFWVLAIAMHTFSVVFLQTRPPRWAFYFMFASGWILTGLVIASGPLFYANDEMGPWYGISAQWCWTSDSYVMPRFTTEYFWMFLAAAASFILYTLLFLKLRGFISAEMRFSFRPQPLGLDTARVGNQMLWYPVVYAVLVFPIAGCRIYEIQTAEMANFEFKMTAAVAFMLSGLANVVLYTITRNIFPMSAILPRFLQPESWRKEHHHGATSSFASSNAPSGKLVFHPAARSDSLSSSIHGPVIHITDPEKYPVIAPDSRTSSPVSPPAAAHIPPKRTLTKKKPSFTMMNPVIKIQAPTPASTIAGQGSLRGSIRSEWHAQRPNSDEWSPTQTFASPMQGRVRRRDSDYGLERARTRTPEPHPHAL